MSNTRDQWFGEITYVTWYSKVTRADGRRVMFHFNVRTFSIFSA